MWELRPRLGIGPIALGMARDEVHSLLGPPKRSQPQGIGYGSVAPAKELFLAENCLEVTYHDDAVSFVGVSGGSGVNVIYEGVDLFRTLFRDIAIWFAEGSDVDVWQDGFPTSWTFPALWLCLWREAKEEDIDADLRAIDDSGLFAKQIAVDRRFSSVQRLGSWKREPRGAPAAVPRAMSTAEVWQMVERREQAGDRWAEVVRAFKVG